MRKVKHALGYILLALIFIGLPISGILSKDPIAIFCGAILIAFYILALAFALLMWLFE